MDILYLDFETRSVHDINDVGLHRYLADKTTSALLLSYAFNDGAVDIWARHRTQKLPEDVLDVINDPKIKLCAWNAGFERHVFGYLFGIEIDCRRFLDPSIMARHLSIPGSLDMAGRTLGLPADMLKMAEEGERLIKKFSMPVDAGGEKTLFGISEPVFRNWNTDAEDWILFESYCKQDTVAEREILKKMRKFPLPDVEWEGWYLDQKINDFGMPTDSLIVDGALSIAYTAKVEKLNSIKSITGVDNPNANPQILAWIRKHGYSFGSLGKPMVARALSGECLLDQDAKNVLLLRKQAAKTSYKKLETLKDIVSADGRVRDMFSFLGSSRAGRWQSHALQFHNLPRPVKEVQKNIERAIELLQAGDYISLSLEFDAPAMEVISSCLRSVFRAPEGYSFIVADLNAIENRGLGWLAGCDAILEVFRKKQDPYIAFATHLYNQPYDVLYEEYKPKDKSKQGDDTKRQMSKPATLGAGYRLSGGVEKLNKYGDVVKTGLWGYAEAMGIKMTQEEAHNAVAVFRKTYPEVVQLWYNLENASFRAIKTGEPQEVGAVVFECFGKKLMRILLPSGRGLHYIRPEIRKVAFGDYGEKPTLTYEGIDLETKQWTRINTHGGKICENIVQAISRDLLLNGMLLADKENLNICGHVHDEIICQEKGDPNKKLDILIRCMTTAPKWASDFPLGAEGFISKYYKKG